jgi:Uma2 family endonuclease
MSTAARRMTTDELLAMPDDGVERWIIKGELRESYINEESREHGMTLRNRHHSRLMIRIGGLIDEWLMKQRRPHGWVVGGEAAIRLASKPETTVCVDVAYVPPEVMAAQTGDSTVIVGAPSLVVEVLSPSDTQKNIAEKVKCYLMNGVKHVWVVDPDLQTVAIYRPKETPVIAGKDGVLTAEPEMPGLQIELAKVFE